jgi:hypothetical protein
MMGEFDWPIVMWDFDFASAPGGDGDAAWVSPRVGLTH